MSLEVYPQLEGKTDVVYLVNWRRVAEDDANNLSDAYGAQKIALNGDEAFTPYSELTKKRVIDWAISALGDEKIAAIDAELARQIADKINPPSITPQLPW